MPNRVENAGFNGQGSVKLTATLDATRLGLIAQLGPGVTRVGTAIECTGMRRYRLHCLQLTGAGPTRVRALVLPYAPNPAAIWEAAVLAAAQVTLTRSAYNFGEGTAILTCLMGPYVAIELLNNGADNATYELELWMQA